MELFRSDLSIRWQCVNVGTRTSSLSTLTYDVHQGSVVGTILFSHHINDVPLYGNKTFCELFADDTSLHNHHTDLNILHASLQNCLDSLIDRTERNHMAIHPDKTRFLPITARQIRQNIVS